MKYYRNKQAVFMAEQDGEIKTHVCIVALFLLKKKTLFYHENNRIKYTNLTVQFLKQLIFYISS
jgi:hypothetical protein